MKSDEVEIVASGLSLVGEGIRSIDSAIREIIDSADRRIQIAAYLVTPGAGPILDAIAQKLDTGIEVTFIVDELYGEKNESVREILEELDETYDHFRLSDFNPKRKRGRLHAKVIIADRKRALLGSANLTWSGRVSNHELAVVFEGEKAAELASVIDRLI